MSSPAVIAAVEARLAEIWDACPVLSENTDGRTPKDGSAFLFVDCPFSTSRQITIGAPGHNVFRENGAVRLALNIERGGGTKDWRLRADALIKGFIGRDLGGVIVKAIDGPATGDNSESGQYFKLLIAVAYEHDFTA